MVPVNPADKILSPALEGFARPACAHQRAICRLGCVLDSPKGVPGRPSWDLQDLEGMHSAPTEGMFTCMCRVVHKHIRIHEWARIRSSIWEVAHVRPPFPLPCNPRHRLCLPPGWHGSHPVHSSLSMQAFHGWDGSSSRVVGVSGGFFLAWSMPFVVTHPPPSQRHRIGRARRNGRSGARLLDQSGRGSCTWRV